MTRISEGGLVVADSRNSATGFLNLRLHKCMSKTESTKLVLRDV